MVELGDQLARFFARLVKAGASLPAAAGLCLYFTISLIEIGGELARNDPLYWLCFGFALILGSIGCLAIARFVYDKWGARNSAPDHT
jgi:hypothetical protein